MKNTNLSLGNFTTEVEAAKAYDRAVLRFRGSSAGATNYSKRKYKNDPVLNELMKIEDETECLERLRETSFDGAKSKSKSGFVGVHKRSCGRYRGKFWTWSFLF